jgi:uridine kinase
LEVSDDASELSHIISAMPELRCPYVVTIYGPSGAGKSQVAKALVEVLGDDVASRVPTDYFLMPRPNGMSFDEYQAQQYEYDWPLMAERLSMPQGTATTTPDFDFEAFTRRAPEGGLGFELRPVMILDAMEPYPDAGLRVLLTVPDEVRRARIAARDRRWGTTVIDRWDQLQATWDAVDERAVLPDLALDATQPIAATAGRIAEKICIL